MEEQVINQKTQLRNSLQDLDFSDQERPSAQTKIIFKLQQLVDSYQPECVFSFFAFKDEPDLSALDAKGSICLYPKITDTQNSEMEFHPWSIGEALTKNHYGIKEPVVKSKPLEVKTYKSMILIPGLLYDYQGNRLGYGGGYYDRYLNSHDFKLKVGICFEQRITSDLPVSAKDIGVDVVITEKRVFYS